MNLLIFGVSYLLGGSGGGRYVAQWERTSRRAGPTFQGFRYLLLELSSLVDVADP
jgi:hypothetical protein